MYIVVYKHRVLRWYIRCGYSIYSATRKRRNSQKRRPPTTMLPNTTGCAPVLPFSKLNKMIFGYFDPENIFLDNENNLFSGWPNRKFGWKGSTGAHRKQATPVQVIALIRDSIHTIPPPLERWALPQTSCTCFEWSERPRVGMFHPGPPRSLP